MSSENPKPQPDRPPAPAQGVTAEPSTPVIKPLFRSIDWWSCALTALVVMLGYFLTLAPDVTLEDAGELAVGSMYAGVPHPPGYPVWTIYTWLFTVLVPVSNIAWRVALSSAVAGAASCGLIALMVSRGSSMLLEGVESLRAIDRKLENWLCLLAGLCAGCLLGFNGFMWSQAVIVEVYTFSVLSLTGVLALLLRWIYAPSQRRYLYWAFFIFGICFTNHQTLVVAAMGLEVLIALANPALGRDMFAGNTIVYLLGLMAKAKGGMHSFDDNAPLFVIYNAIGLGSMAVTVWLWLQTKKLLTEWKAVVYCGILWALGAAFYFYMPLTSMTNPPMNWGYPRTYDGFVHALTRGQYEKTNPTTSVLKFMDQSRMYAEGASEEFGAIFVLLSLFPLFFLGRMQRRERAWIGGLAAVWFCLAVLLLILMNPGTDKQSRELIRVFFTASHVIVAMGIGYGLTLAGGLMAVHYQQVRGRMLWAGAVATGLSLYSLAHTFDGTYYTILRLAAVVGLALPAVFTLAVLAFRQTAPTPVFLLLIFFVPLQSVLAHWSDNEQRGHLFGYWFGHDMFTPPFKDKGGKQLYPEMTKDAVLFGGTDPGRFNPTYMIFCESFTPPSKKPLDPQFDRRDVYLITQNALADGTYLNYIRAHYNRSAQKDTPFFQELLRSQRDVETQSTNLLARMAAPVDRFFTDFGAKVEERRRKEGVYPKKEIITPTPEDSFQCYNEYIYDAQVRSQRGMLKPGEDVRVIDGKAQVSGQVAVMSINALLAKIIFDKNPSHEFYIEESFPLDWMYPYLSPFGIIMKINRQPLGEMSQEIVDKDHEFWSQYSTRLIGNWIRYDTTVKQICEFAERVYLRRDYSGFDGDRKFIRDDNAQKAFSKLRSSLAGVYSWRVNNSKNPVEQQRMLKEADFAFRQAFAFCPFSPEAVFRYVNLLATQGRLDDALLISETCLKLDSENTNVAGLVAQLRDMRDRQKGSLTPAQVQQLESDLRNNPTNLTTAFNLAVNYLHQGDTNGALRILDQLAVNPSSDATILLSVADAYSKLFQTSRLEPLFLRIVKVTPDSPEAWYDLAGIQTAMDKPAEAAKSLGQALLLSRQRVAKQPNARDLLKEALGDPRFVPLKNRPDFQALFRN